MKAADRATPAPTGPRVIVAPMEDLSTDVDAPVIVRAAFVAQLAKQGWNVVPTEEADTLFNERLGINYGGQMKTTTPSEVCDLLGVSGVFIGTVTEWNKTTTGVINKIVVNVEASFYNASGAELWKGAGKATRDMSPRVGGQNYGSELVAKAIFNLVANPVTPVGREAGTDMARKVPSSLVGRLVETKKVAVPASESADGEKGGER